MLGRVHVVLGHVLRDRQMRHDVGVHASVRRVVGKGQRQRLGEPAEWFRRLRDKVDHVGPPSDRSQRERECGLGGDDLLDLAAHVVLQAVGRHERVDQRDVGGHALGRRRIHAIAEPIHGDRHLDGHDDRALSETRHRRSVYGARMPKAEHADRRMTTGGQP